MSEGFNVPNTLWYLRRPVVLTSCTHRACIRRCRTFPEPLLLVIPNAAEESASTSPIISHPMSLASPITPSTSADTATIAWSSASALLSATVFCCLL